MSTDAEAYQRIRLEGAIVDLTARARFRLSGNDRVRYLNGQVSNDVRKATQQASIYTCVMTAKGKMCGDLFVSVEGESFRLDTEPELREPMAARLERYIIADDVALEDRTDDTALIHAFGPTAAKLPDVSGARRIRSQRFGVPGVDLALDRAAFATAWNELSEVVPVASDAMIETIRVEQGVPRWGRELDENTIPLEAGLEARAIDFAKGCYIGQEVISRIKNIGHVNRELCGLLMVEGTPPEPGAQLFSSDLPAGESAHSIGRITSVAHSFALSKPVALGYVKRDQGTPGTVLKFHAASGAAGRVEVRNLPFVSL